MATLAFTGTERKVFVPVATALRNLRNAQAGTIICLVQQTVTGQQDFAGVTDTTSANFYHSLSNQASALADDDGVVGSGASSTWPQNTTNWYLIAVDWSATMATVERFHWRDQTGLGSWTHSPAVAANGGTAGAPATAWLRLGFTGDFSTGSKLQGLTAIWAGTRFADADYGLWTKTSDLYSHSAGPPTFLCELNATTLVDLMGGSTYSSANSTGTTLTGADPDNWTFDGTGSGSAAVPVTGSAFQAIPFMAPTIFA